MNVHTSVTAHTEGQELQVDFTEVGLKPRQNYAYTGQAESATTRFRCYTNDTFEPRSKSFVVKTNLTVGSPFGFTANKRGVVAGYFLIDPILPAFTRAQQCPKNQSPIPVHESYTNYQVININTADDATVIGTVSGAIEPD